MPRYIDEELLLQKLSRMVDYCQTDPKVSGLTALFQVGDAIMDCPAVDVVPEVEIKRMQECISELYKLLDTIIENAKNHNLSLLRVKGGASGCDCYQGAPPICRAMDKILEKYDDVIYAACTFWEIENIKKKCVEREEQNA